MGYMAGGAMMATLLWIFLGRANRQRETLQQDRRNQGARGDDEKDVEGLPPQKVEGVDEEERARRLGDRHERFRYNV
jgi:hypothetical protein